MDAGPVRYNFVRSQIGFRVARSRRLVLAAVAGGAAVTSVVILFVRMLASAARSRTLVLASPSLEAQRVTSAVTLLVRMLASAARSRTLVVTSVARGAALTRVFGDPVRNLPEVCNPELKWIDWILYRHVSTDRVYSCRVSYTRETFLWKTVVYGIAGLSVGRLNGVTAK